MNLWKRLLDLLLPRRCVVCGCWLAVNEKAICPSCLTTLHPIEYASYTDNTVVRRFWERMPVRKGYSFTYYYKDASYHGIFAAMKFNGRPDVCFRMGEATAATPLSNGFFDDIDLIIPIPLSRQRKRKRGYNQAEHIALGISKVTGIPVNTKALRRIVDNKSQTHAASSTERTQNVASIFKVTDAESLKGKHILLVDDIITTGSTMISAMSEILTAQRPCIFSDKNEILSAQPQCIFSVMSVGLTAR